MPSLRATLLALSYGAMSVACTVVNEPPSGQNAEAVQKTCGDYAQALCAKIDECKKGGTTNTYGSLGACISEQTTSCVAAQESPGDGNSAASTASCASALPSASCDDYLTNNLTMCPQHTGQLANGRGCVFSSQCLSGFCALALGDSCGACATAPQAGDECTDQGCGRDMACTPQKVCEPYVATNGECDNQTKVCAPNSQCVIPANATTGTCQLEVTTLGATCDHKHQTGPGCAPDSGLYCAASNTCVAITYVSDGSPCGSQNAGASDDVCSNASVCWDGTCVADALEGDACDIANGPSCVPGTRCYTTDVTTTSGTCVVQAAATCGP